MLDIILIIEMVTVSIISLQAYGGSGVLLSQKDLSSHLSPINIFLSIQKLIN
jgi:hypothetical protein